MLAGGSAIGLAVALVSIVANAVLSKSAGIQLLAPFALGCIALVTGIRQGVSLPVLRRAATLLVGAFLFGMCLLTTKMDWAQLKWFVLLPGDVAAAERRERRHGAARVSDAIGRRKHFARDRARRRGHRREVAALERSTRWSSVRPLLRDRPADRPRPLHREHRRPAEHPSPRAAPFRGGKRGCCARSSPCAPVPPHPRDHEGWVAIEDYMTRHKATDLTHGICPECSARVSEEMARAEGRSARSCGVLVR